MEQVYGPDRSQLIEAFLMDELLARMEHMRALREREQRQGGLSAELMNVRLALRQEEEDIAIALWYLSDALEHPLPPADRAKAKQRAKERAGQRLVVAVLLLRFAVGPGHKVGWPGKLKEYFSEFSLMCLVPRLEGDAIVRWYRGLSIHSQRLAAEDWEDWLSGSSADLVRAYEDASSCFDLADTDRPPPP